MDAARPKRGITTSAMEGTITTIDDILVRKSQRLLSRMMMPEKPSITSKGQFSKSHGAMQDNPRSPDGFSKMPTSFFFDWPFTLTGEREKRPGEYKRQSNAIGKTGDDVFSARYVPPPPQETEDCMAALERYINRDNRQEGEELIDLALAHYQLEAIHPFQDGNGRIGCTNAKSVSRPFANGTHEAPAASS
ncbi:MAG: Fic family protein [Hyphomicrobiales bacterium]